MFAGTPDSVCYKIWMHILASDPTLAMAIVDMEPAFFQPRLKKEKGERLVLEPPPDLKKKGVLWDMNAPLYGWRFASVSWQDHQAEKYERMGFRRNPMKNGMYVHERWSRQG